MDKAYDIVELQKLLKDHGLELAEEAAKKLVVSLFAWIQSSAVKSDNKYDDLLLAILPIALPEIMKQLENINPSDNVQG